MRLLRQIVAFVALAIALAQPASALDHKLIPLLTACPGSAQLQPGLCPSVDANFATGQAWVRGVGYVPWSQILSVTNSTGGYVTNADGTLSLIGANLPRIGSGTGLLVEQGSTNLAKYS